MSPNCGNTSPVLPFASASQLAGDERQILVLCCFDCNICNIQNSKGCHWLNIETGRHQDIARQDETCQLFYHRVLYPGLPAAPFDSFDSGEDADDPIEDEHHVLFACSGYVSARQLFQDLFSQSISTCWPVPEPAQIQPCSQVLTCGLAVSA